MTSKKRSPSDPSSSDKLPVDPASGPSFETALEELETIVRELEHDDLTLDSALSLFERGIKLMRTCDTQLNHARGKITELFKGEDGAFAEKVLGMSLESFLKEENIDD